MLEEVRVLVGGFGEEDDWFVHYLLAFAREEVAVGGQGALEAGQVVAGGRLCWLRARLGDAVVLPRDQLPLCIEHLLLELAHQAKPPGFRMRPHPNHQLRDILDLPTHFAHVADLVPCVLYSEPHQIDSFQLILRLDFHIMVDNLAFGVDELTGGLGADYGVVLEGVGVDYGVVGVPERTGAGRVCSVGGY